MPTKAAGQARGSVDRHGRLAEEMAEDADLQRRRYRGVRDDNVHGMRGQLGEQPLRLVDPHMQTEGRPHGRRRLEEAVGRQLGERVGDADAKASPGVVRISWERLQQFAAAREDLVGVAEDLLPVPRKPERPPLTLQQLLPKRPLQRPHLHADGGRRNVQQCRSLGDAVLLGDGPAGEQMAVVQAFHGGRLDGGSRDQSNGRSAANQRSTGRSPRASSPQPPSTRARFAGSQRKQRPGRTIPAAAAFHQAAAPPRGGDGPAGDLPGLLVRRLAGPAGPTSACGKRPPACTRRPFACRGGQGPRSARPLASSADSPGRASGSPLRQASVAGAAAHRRIIGYVA